ncbi:MAG: class I SAM-dependent methyltransferase [Leptolyngbya sp. SIO4C1]|nr:class I SAM-dependent methyltransferase [Leptolyngbya sp. SIO4C1]
MFVTQIPETAEIQANQRYFNHPEWAKTYFDACHRDPLFKERWQAAAGSWNNKVIVDVGCGPGNLYATLGGKPKLLIGVDVAKGALKMAQEIGYTPLLADAHQIPLKSGCADLVVVNATLHHCDNMATVLAEAARLVRPGGQLVVDHDPQLSAWDYKGLALLLYKIRLSILYRFFLRRLHIPLEERLTALATEIHHHPGHGVTTELFLKTLLPMGFKANIYPHNNAIGAKALEGNYGPQPHWRYRVGQILSGINPFAPTAALSLMCIATKHGD